MPQLLMCRVIVILGLIFKLSIAAYDFGKFVVGPISSHLNVPGGYFTISGMNYTDSFVPQRNSCIDHARHFREPYTSRYWRRNSMEQLDDENPVLFWQWDGIIEEKQFRAAAAHFARYKLVGGQVYVDPTSVEPRHQKRQARIEELFRFMAYLYPLPDMEFLMSYHDGCVPGKPVFAFCACRQFPNVGFSMPSYSAWTNSLGPNQMVLYHTCLTKRYPAGNRKPQVVWRGSTTGYVPTSTVEACMQLLRVRIHLLSRQHPDLLDTRITYLLQRCADILKPIINDTARTIQHEAANQYCVILDVDGNSWSDRYAASLVHFPTPILKMASNYSGYVEHVFPPGIAIEEFDSDLSTLVDKAREMIEDCKKGEESKGQALARRSQALSRKVLDHVGVASSMAYGLMQYKRLSAFQPNLSLEGYVKSNRPCCMTVRLPPEVLEELNRDTVAQ